MLLIATLALGLGFALGVAVTITVSRRPQIPENYRTLFVYYDMGYDHQKSGASRIDWNKLLNEKSGLELVRFKREVRSYNLGYSEAGEDLPRRTEKIMRTSAEQDRLWGELNESLE